MVYRRMQERFKRWVWIGFVSMFSALAVSFVFIVLGTRAKDDASAVRQGNEGRFEILGDGVIVVFDPEEQRTLRIPVGETVVSLGDC